VGRIDFYNSTALTSAKLIALMSEAIADWAVGKVTVKVRYSRGADFSGTCVYADRRILINLGRHLRYPYRMGTHLARTRTAGRHWIKPVYTVELASGYEVVLFVFMHELYHLLVKRAGRNVRQKESMCDRFAARYVVDRFGATVRSEAGDAIPREQWIFQDLDGFVLAARNRDAARRLVQPGGLKPNPFGKAPPLSEPDGQLLLFSE
jgi:hypothetical protein